MLLMLPKENKPNCCIEASRGAGAKSETVIATGCGFDPQTRELNIHLNLYFHFFVSTTQHAMQSGERSVLTLGSLCLPYCVQNTA